MLYFKALREGLSALPPADPDMRLVIDTMAADIGWPALHATLAKLDPETAARLEPTDTQRIQRALEVCWLTGRAMSEVIAAGRGRAAAAPDDRRCRWNPRTDRSCTNASPRASRTCSNSA